MQFRVLESGTVLCLVNKYSAERRRSVQTQVAKFPSDATRLPRSLVPDLTDEQYAEASAWVAARASAERRRRDYNLAASATTGLRLLAEALLDPDRRGDAVAGLDADSMWTVLDKLTEALREAGATRPITD